MQTLPNSQRSGAHSPSAARRRIRQLPRQLVDKIAAGEVVERPASVVKELLENSLDAGASRIELEVEGGGSRLIRISDDGLGVPRDELHLAVTSHATSKIQVAEDLFQIASLGFRGEALASIAAVSHLRIASRPEDEDGAELRVDGGRMGKVQDMGLPRGTTIEVGDLFYNVPARRAFLRTERGELRALVAEVRRQALCRNEVSFRVLHEGKVLLDAPATDEPRERIAQILGRELAEDLLVIPRDEGEGLALRGYITPVDRSRGDSRQQFFFLNRRCVRDVTLLTAIKQSYANLLPPRRHPIGLLWIDLDPAAVDVNVHPQKAEVRFRAERMIFGRVVKATQTALRAGGMVRELRLPQRHGLGAPGSFAPASPGGASPGGAPLWAQPRSPSEGSPPAASSASPLLLPFAPGQAGAPAGAAVSGLGGRFFQLHRSYVVEQSSAGLRIVDPHALHERILYEQIVTRLAEEPLESQTFLFPLVVEVTGEEQLMLDERAPSLARLGFQVEAFGQGLAVHAAPRLLRADRVERTLQDLLRELPAQHDEEAEQGLLHDLAAHLACRSAVRFGDPLGDAQIEELLRKRDEVPRGHCCPHGRPTALALSRDELDHRFGRQGFVAPER